MFLDEIGDMPLMLQTRLLRVIEEREVVPLGSDQAIPVDLHVISATHRDIRQMILAANSAKTSTIASTASRCTCRCCAIAATRPN